MARVDIGDITFGRLPRPGQPSVRTGDISYGMLPRPGGPSVGIGDITFGRLPRPSPYDEWLMSHYASTPEPSMHLGPQGAPSPFQFEGLGPEAIPTPGEYAQAQAAGEAMRNPSFGPDGMFPMQPGAQEMKRLAHMQNYPHQYGIDSLGGGPQPAAPSPGGFGGMEIRGFSDPVPGRVDMGQDLEQTLAASGSPDDSWPMQYGEGQRMRIEDMMANPGRYEPEPSVSFGQPVIGNQPPAPGGFEFDWDRPPVPARVDLGQDMERTLAGRPDDSWPMQADPMAARQIAEMSAQASVPGVQPGAMAGPYIPGARMSDPTASPVPDFDMGSMAESPEYMNLQLQQLDDALTNQRDVFPRMGADAGGGLGWSDMNDRQRARHMAQSATPGQASKRRRPASKMQKKVMEMFGGDMAAYDAWHGSLSSSNKKKVNNWSKAFKHLAENPLSAMGGAISSEPSPESEYETTSDLTGGGVSSIGGGGATGSFYDDPYQGVLGGRQPGMIASIEKDDAFERLLSQSMPQGGPNMSYERPYDQHMSMRRTFPSIVPDPYGYGAAARAILGRRGY